MCPAFSIFGMLTHLWDPTVFFSLNRCFSESREAKYYNRTLCGIKLPNQPFFVFQKMEFFNWKLFECKFYTGWKLNSCEILALNLILIVSGYCNGTKYISTFLLKRKKDNELRSAIKVNRFADTKEPRVFYITLLRFTFTLCVTLASIW